MSLTIILGRAGAGKTVHCLNEAVAEMNAAPDGAPILFLVPEQATFQIERELAVRSAQGAFARAHVLGFRRLAHKVLAETGGAAQPQLTDLGKRLALRRLLVKHQDELKILGRAARQRTFAETLASAIWEFKTWCIRADQLDEIQQKLGETPLGAKVHDLTLLYRRFEEFLAGRYRDPEDALTLLAQRLSQSELVRGAHVYIDGFHWFTPQEYGVLEALLKAAVQVTVTLCLDEPEQEDHKSDTDVFHRAWTTWQDMKQTARRLGVPVSEQVLERGRRFQQAPVLGYLEQSFFAPAAVPFAGDCSGLTVAEAANRRLEVEAIARQMIRLCRDKGYRWRDLAVLLPDGDSYSELFETVLADYDIPYFTDRRRPAVHHPLAELIRSSLETVCENWTYDPLFRCLKTDLFPLKRGDIDILENYCLEFGIRGSRWTEDKSWHFVRRLTLEEDSELNQGEQAYLKKINKVRQIVRQPLLAFQQELKGAQTVRDYTTAVYNFLTELGVPDKLERWAMRAEAAGDLDQSREHHQLWDGVINLFDQMVETCGDEELTLSEYAEVLGEGLEGLALNLIPPGLDYVTLSTLERGRTISAKAVFVPGVNDGILPKRGREEGLLTDAERQQMADWGISLAPGAVADAFHEQFAVYTALTRASNYLWLSYPLADEEGKSLAPSLILDRLKRLRVTEMYQSFPAEPQPGSEAEYLVHPRSAVSALARGLRNMMTAGSQEPLWWQVYNWAQASEAARHYTARVVDGIFHRNQAEPLPKDIARQLYMKTGNLHGSVTRFEGYRACPFQYFSRYGLNLKPRAVFRLAAPDFGQFLHAILKAFGDQLAAEGRTWRDVALDEAAERCRSITEQLAPRLQNEILLSSRHYQHVQSRLERTASRSLERLIRFAGVSSFQPVALEQSFGRGETDWPPLTFQLDNGVTVELAGQIDRLDKAELDGQTYLLVVDYKSGQAGIRLTDVVHGLKLQLITYLLAACQAAEQLGLSEALPAGALYYFLKNPKVTAKKLLDDEQISAAIGKELKMPGWVLAQPEVVKLLDGSIDGWSEYVKVWLKNGKFHGSNGHVLKSEEQFSILMEHAKRMVTETACEILAGQVAIAPYNLKDRTPCGFCDYQPVCQFDNSLPHNDYRLLPELSDEEAWNLLQAAKGGQAE